MDDLYMARRRKMEGPKLSHYERDVLAMKRLLETYGYKGADVLVPPRFRRMTLDEKLRYVEQWLTAA